SGAAPQPQSSAGLRGGRPFAQVSGAIRALAKSWTRRHQAITRRRALLRQITQITPGVYAASKTLPGRTHRANSPPAYAAPLRGGLHMQTTPPATPRYAKIHSSPVGGPPQAPSPCGAATTLIASRLRAHRPARAAVR